MKIISRTISEKVYSVVTLDIKTAEVATNEYSLGSADFKGKASALKALQDRYNTDTLRLVDIVSVSNKEALYVMTEEAFIKAAFPVRDMKEARQILKSAGEELEEAGE